MIHHQWQSSKRTKRLSEKTIEAIVEKVGEYYGLPLSVRFEDVRTASIDVAHLVMILPRWITQTDIPEASFYINHEIGHIVYFPKNAHQKAYMEALALERGINTPDIFLNMLSDQIVNDKCIIESPFKKNFLSGCTSFYKRNYGRLDDSASDAMWWHMGNMLRRCLEVKGKKPPEFRSELERRLFELVFHDEREISEKYLDIVAIAKPMFSKPPNITKLYMIPSPSLPPISDPEELDEWLKKMGKVSKEAAYRVLKRYGKRVLFDYVELSAFEAFIIAQKSAEQKAMKRDGRGETLDIWNPTDRVGDLTMEKTLSMYGLFLPSVTSLKYTASHEDTSESRGAGLQCYVIDRSGSMYEAIDLVATIVWACIRHAKTRGDDIAILAFGDEDSPEFLLKPTMNYEAARPILESMEALGSTYLSPCLSWLIDYCASKNLKPTTLIFTDTMIFDEAQSLKLLRKIKEIGGTTIIISTMQEQEWVNKAIQSKLAECFRVNYENLSNIQKIVERVVAGT
jgi:Mg-chelatase subunit ChlD